MDQCNTVSELQELQEDSEKLYEIVDRKEMGNGNVTVFFLQELGYSRDEHWRIKTVVNESKLAVVRLLQLFSFGVDNDFTIRQSEEDVVDDGVIIDR